jgi:hypothetical protein
MKTKNWKIAYKDGSGPDRITDEKDDFVCTTDLLGPEYPGPNSFDELEEKDQINLRLIVAAPKIQGK